MLGNPSSADDSTEPEKVISTEEPEVIQEESLEIGSDDLATEGEVESNSSEELTVQKDTSEDNSDDNTTTRISWKKKYRELDKRFRNLKASNDSTIFELRKDLARSMKDCNEFSRKLSSANKELNSFKSQVDQSLDLLSDEEKDILGEDTINSFKKMNKASIEAAIAPLKEQLEEARRLRDEKLEEDARTQDLVANNNFLSRLEELVPNFTSIDHDPNFHVWMDGPDDYSGDQRKALFKRAQSIGDVGRVAQFFNEFKKLNSRGEESLRQKISPTQATSKPVSTKTVTSNPKKNYVSLKAVDKFLSDVAKGYYKGREKSMQEIEAKIDKAQREGRIVA